MIVPQMNVENNKDTLGTGNLLCPHENGSQTADSLGAFVWIKTSPSYLLSPPYAVGRFFRTVAQ